MGAMSPIPRDLSLYGHKQDRRKDGTHEMNGPYTYSTCFGAEVKVVLLEVEKIRLVSRSAFIPHTGSIAMRLVGVHHCLYPLKKNNISIIQIK